jgi:hypothetical protein
MSRKIGSVNKSNLEKLREYLKNEHKFKSDNTKFKNDKPKPPSIKGF